MQKRISIIGFGRMGSALARGIQGKRLGSVIASDKSNENLEAAKRSGFATTTSNSEAVEKSDLVILAVKPQDIGGVLDGISPSVRDQIIISIAAGIPLRFLESKLSGRKVFRVMPNLPCLVGEMAAGFAAGKHCGEDDKRLVKEILEANGLVFEVEEELLDVVTALSGSGPGFFAYMIDVMAKKAMHLGLEKEVSLKLAEQTCLGTGKLLLEKGIKPDELVRMVKSPGGTTEAGLKELEGAKEILEETIEAAFRRSKELGKND